MLADNLNMEPAEAEKWVVNMIRLAHLDAKIDSKCKNRLVSDNEYIKPTIFRRLFWRDFPLIEYYMQCPKKIKSLNRPSFIICVL